MAGDLILLFVGLAAFAGWQVWAAHARRQAVARGGGAIRRSEAPRLFWTTVCVAGMTLATFAAVVALAAHRLLVPPLGDRAAALYPSRALEQSVQGLVILHCTVTPDYGVKDCRVASETPAGMGFGASALQISALEVIPAKDRPRAKPGEPINLPIRFKMPEQKP